ncbi:hypothetical protein O6H91_02G152100 [Diphasiastrum complanatum]|uniref:Uncharacterized protein n=1 Tax=Diphasiastrum complanatum TaxID=34168 RepID=A0ACC2EM55_DIPCM|nr:hypothetical protein O6H91_02G152100 [Diphasiastrum complanatum]
MSKRRAMLPLISIHVLLLFLWQIQVFSAAGAGFDGFKDLRMAGFDLLADILGLTNTAEWAAFTIFTPGDTAIALLALTEPISDLIRYHIAPQWLSYKNLTSLPLGTQIGTLLPNNTLLVTSVQDSDLSTDFTLDNVGIILPELYFDERIIVHGISDVMNPLIYGTASSNIMEIPVA